MDAGRTADVAGTGGFVHVHVQVGIRTSEAPGVSGSPFGGDFGSLGNATESIAELRRKQKMSGAGTGFEEGLARDVLAKKFVVNIIATSDIDIEFTTQETAVAEFIPIKLFGSEIGVSVEASEERTPFDAVCSRRG